MAVARYFVMGCKGGRENGAKSLADLWGVFPSSSLREAENLRAPARTCQVENGLFGGITMPLKY